ncbi:hypothetical protein EUGRSUZ_K01178 [Eucalyptus grandis]|uniref:Uncharacterized protein n=2 Tax=Eucalyptus grandis TaxID=71139 RepID=A0ACC3ITH2_EUCGR|nr:hypothetical protein EUGRSUZ_K01178 [Eucalyptus grandis]
MEENPRLRPPISRKRDRSAIVVVVDVADQRAEPAREPLREKNEEPERSSESHLVRTNTGGEICNELQLHSPETGISAEEELITAENRERAPEI